MSYGGGDENTVEIHRTEIDAITGPDIPFFMMSKTEHAGWANTKALELAGVTDDEKPIDKAYLSESDWEIDIAGKRYPLRVSLASRAMYDPKMEKVRA